MRWLLLLLTACSSTTIVYVTPGDSGDSGMVETAVDARADADAGVDAAADVQASDVQEAGCMQPQTETDCPSHINEVACASKPGTYWLCEFGKWRTFNCQGQCPSCACWDGGQ